MKDYKMLLTMLELHARWFTEKGDPEAAEDLSEAAAAIRELREYCGRLRGVIIETSLGLNDAGFDSSAKIMLDALEKADETHPPHPQEADGT